MDNTTVGLSDAYGEVPWVRGELREATYQRLRDNPPLLACLKAIVAGRHYWTYVSVLVDAGHSESTLTALETNDGHPLVVRWMREGFVGPGVTLTPWGAYVLGTELVERGDRKPTARWQALDPDEEAERRQAERKDMGNRRAWQEFHSLQWPNEVEDHREPPPELLIDEESGQEVRLFVGGDGAQVDVPPTLRGGLGGRVEFGVTVRIEPKLGKRRTRKSKGRL